jgi:hypothetical protein
MPLTLLTTTLSELNRLYSVYCEVASKKTPDSQEAHRAWTVNETYTKRYKDERGM